MTPHRPGMDPQVKLSSWETGEPGEPSSGPVSAFSTEQIPVLQRDLLIYYCGCFKSPATLLSLHILLDFDGF